MSVFPILVITEGSARTNLTIMNANVFMVTMDQHVGKVRVSVNEF